MVKIFYDTNRIAARIRELLTWGALPLKLKGDIEAPHFEGLQKAWSAQLMAQETLDDLKAQENLDPHEIGRFKELLQEATEMVRGYRKVFGLTAVPQNGGGVEVRRTADVQRVGDKFRKPGHVHPNPARGERHYKAAINAAQAAAIKQVLVDYPTPLDRSAYIEIAAIMGKPVTDDIIYGIATNRTWNDVPWPDARRPVFASLAKE